MHCMKGREGYPGRGRESKKGSVNFNGVTSITYLIYYNKMRFNQAVVRMNGDEVKKWKRRELLRCTWGSVESSVHKRHRRNPVECRGSGKGKS